MGLGYASKIPIINKLASGKMGFCCQVVWRKISLGFSVKLTLIKLQEKIKTPMNLKIFLLGNLNRKVMLVMVLLVYLYLKTANVNMLQELRPL
jgi:hypothetical protein